MYRKESEPYTGFQIPARRRRGHLLSGVGYGLNRSPDIVKTNRWAAIFGPAWVGVGYRGLTGPASCKFCHVIVNRKELKYVWRSRIGVE